MSGIVYRCALVVTLIALLSPGVRAESPEETIRQLQKQIDALSRQLQPQEDPFQVPDKKLTPEEEEGRYSKITQISQTRVIPPPRQEEIVLTRLYDLSDLFAVAPAYPARFESDLMHGTADVFPRMMGAQSGGQQTGGSMGGGMGGGGGGGFFNIFPQGKAVEKHGEPLAQFGVGAAGNSLDAARTSVDNLIRAIQTTVSPDIWENQGGSSTIAQLGLALLITTNSDTHQQIEALLSQFRKRWGTLRTVSLHAYWLWLDDAQLKGLLQTKEADGKQQTGPFAHGTVRRAEWEKLITGGPAEQEAGAEAADDAQTIARQGYRAAITCYNGQTVHTQTGRQEMIVTDIQPKWFGPEKVEKEAPAIGSVGYVPQTTLVQSGAILQVTPLTNTSGKYVVLDLQSRVTSLGEGASLLPEGNKDEAAANEEGVPGPETILAALKLRPMDISRLSTTLRVPVGEPYLVGGMCETARPKAGGPQMYLFIEAFVQELRDDVETPVNVSAKPAEGKPVAP